MRKQMSMAELKHTGKQFIKFNLVGLLNTAIDIAVFSLLAAWAVPVVLAQICGYAAGMTSSYVLNSKFTFKPAPQTADIKARYDSEDRVAIRRDKRGIRFLIWNLIMLLLSACLIAVLVQWLQMQTAIAKAIVTAAVLAVNFAGMKQWVFKEKSHEKGQT